MLINIIPDEIQYRCQINNAENSNTAGTETAEKTVYFQYCKENKYVYYIKRST